MAIKREASAVRALPMTTEEAQRAHDLTTAIHREPGLYRRKFRA
jgi:hypothetical protein